ncbi:MAG: acetylornithine deacetylase [Solirubrobacteraceae bacterium]|jgi:acetylornithine deacetylase|nr:acetylornithine deacetylase [Solirubrobacteraceae bacterium]
MDATTRTGTDPATDLLARLVAIDSVNPALVPGGAGEAAIAAVVAAWLAEHGLEVAVDEALPGRPSVVGVARGSGGGRSLMLNAHLDTVTVAGMERPHEPRIRDGRLYGRGAYDMKGGLAAIMLAGAAAAGAGLRGDVLVTAVADEEHASEGVQSVLRRWTADACIVTEPTHLRACVAHKGFAWAELEVLGRAAHGSRPDLGVDAIVGMGPVLAGMRDLQRALAARPHPLLGPASLHASLIQGGEELSSYPGRCVLGVERRTLPGETAADVEAELRGLLALAREADERLETELRLGLVREPFEVDPGAPVVTTLLAAAEATLGAAPEVVGDHPWMDAAFTAAAGIPTVVFGPGGGGAHAVEEHADLESVRRCTDVLIATAHRWCS